SGRVGSRRFREKPPYQLMWGLFVFPRFFILLFNIPLSESHFSFSVSIFFPVCNLLLIFTE
ncbi:hypothetical protein, partial [Bacteroides oleiciplenus]|uniref:hypothetical protein n=1 Tax=Bacteroides oleiciplenus TaxID=626931 RepID=UPI001C6FF36F